MRLSFASIASAQCLRLFYSFFPSFFPLSSSLFFTLFFAPSSINPSISRRVLPCRCPQDVSLQRGACDRNSDGDGAHTPPPRRDVRMKLANTVRLRMIFRSFNSFPYSSSISISVSVWRSFLFLLLFLCLFLLVTLRLLPTGVATARAYMPSYMENAVPSSKNTRYTSTKGAASERGINVSYSTEIS